MFCKSFVRLFWISGSDLSFKVYDLKLLKIKSSANHLSGSFEYLAVTWVLKF